MRDEYQQGVMGIGLELRVANGWVDEESIPRAIRRPYDQLPGRRMLGPYGSSLVGRIGTNGGGLRSSLRPRLSLCSWFLLLRTGIALGGRGVHSFLLLGSPFLVLPASPISDRAVNFFLELICSLGFLPQVE